MLAILLTFHILVSIALAVVVLLQRSEGGALGMGGGPTGFMTARGAGDLLTRATWILGGLFFALSLALTLLSGRVSNSNDSVVDRLKVEKVDPNSLNLPATSPNVPANGIPGPLSAPTPQVRNPFTGAAEDTAPAPATAPIAP